MTSHSESAYVARAPSTWSRTWQRTLCAALCALIAPAAFPHHSFAMFDQSKEVTVRGTVKVFQWTNPHSFIELTTPNPDGSTDLWSVELNSPNNLKRQGWKSDSVQVGDKITLVLNPLRDGRRGGLFVSLTRSDGSILGDPTRRGGGPINVPPEK